MRGEVVEEGKVRLGVRLTFQSLDRTLTNAEVDAMCTVIKEELEKAGIEIL